MRREVDVTLGELERRVMDVVWRADGALTVRQVGEHFPDHAYTTIMTVLTRLSTKGFVIESREGRTRLYRPTASREAYITSLLMDALSDAEDRRAVLAHFAESLPAHERSFVRSILARVKPRRPT